MVSQLVVCEIYFQVSSQISMSASNSPASLVGYLASSMLAVSSEATIVCQLGPQVQRVQTSPLAVKLL